MEPFKKRSNPYEALPDTHIIYTLNPNSHTTKIQSPKAKALTLNPKTLKP